MNLACPAQFSSVQLLSRPGLQHARPPAAPGFVSKKAGMENDSRLLVSEVGGATPAERWSQSKSFCENLCPQAAEGGEKN